MQREWDDPRDGTHWLVTVTPFGWRPLRGAKTASRLTVSFHLPGTTPLWTSYPLPKALESATDQELMDLLDAVREPLHGPLNHRELPQRWGLEYGTLGG